MLHVLFIKILKEEQEPLTDWKEGHLIKTPKNGDLSKCKNHKGITLLSVPGKVLSKILLNSMKDAVDTQLRNQQAGFRKDRSRTDQITTLRIIVQQSIEWNSSLYINFCDYEKAFDSVVRRVAGKILNITRNSYDGLQCKVVRGGQLTDAF
ncbi:unnamed protein product [Schistosoma mattheei]|uniref:Uncharacterized protein n=1 Tax=Schistosoma mattheei TaxID=31246 RepID=A0A183PS84_9TREM|nr:unnamed protein product [Schistosoma mattheei]